MQAPADKPTCIRPCCWGLLAPGCTHHQHHCPHHPAGALKSLFTRTGKRSVWGLLDDGVKSLVRYYLNNFQDGKKQDAVDMVTGAYDLKGERRAGGMLGGLHYVRCLQNLQLLVLEVSLHMLR